MRIGDKKGITIGVGGTNLRIVERKDNIAFTAWDTYIGSKEHTFSIEFEQKKYLHKAFTF